MAETSMVIQAQRLAAAALAGQVISPAGAPLIRVPFRVAELLRTVRSSPELQVCAWLEPLVAHGYLDLHAVQEIFSELCASMLAVVVEPVNLRSDDEVWESYCAALRVAPADVQNLKIACLCASVELKATPTAVASRVWLEDAATISSLLSLPNKSLVCHLRALLRVSARAS